MDNRVTFRGPVGELRWGYHAAAVIGSWTVSSDASGLKLTGTVTELDDYKASQRPLEFVVTRPQGSAWTWPIESLQIADGSVSAVLRPQE